MQPRLAGVYVCLFVSKSRVSLPGPREDSRVSSLGSFARKSGCLYGIRVSIWKRKCSPKKSRVFLLSRLIFFSILLSQKFCLGVRMNFYTHEFSLSSPTTARDQRNEKRVHKLSLFFSPSESPGVPYSSF